MIRMILILIVLVFYSCSIPENKVIDDEIEIFESNKSLFSNLSVDILRRQKNPSVIEYKVIKKDKAGYAIFQTYPDLVIFKNIYSDSIDMNFVEKINKLNKQKSIRLLKLKSIDNEVQLELKIYDNTIIIFKGEKMKNKFLNKNDSVYKLANNWNYIKKPFIGER